MGIMICVIKPANGGFLRRREIRFKVAHGCRRALRRVFLIRA
jgi:hypothetical protein